MVKALVAYASKYGATAEIAQTIAATLTDRDFEVDLSPAEAVRSVEGYDVVVIGSGVYAGNWLSGASDFIKHFADVLADKAVYIFSSGPTGEGDPVTLLNGWIFPESLQEVANRIHPRDITLFHGKIDLDKLNWGERLIIRAVRGATGDARDWTMIRAWAEKITA
jgi:menaquinone-dependent protoporphyrinogen oxidase